VPHLVTNGRGGGKALRLPREMVPGLVGTGALELIAAVATDVGPDDALLRIRMLLLVCIKGKGRGRSFMSVYSIKVHSMASPILHSSHVHLL
jgi:hypothetical protein